jgi:hypothetical protein
VFAVRDSASIDPTAARSRHLDEIFAGKESPEGQPVLYVCQNYVCQAPAVGLAAIESALDRIAAPSRVGSAI